MIVVLVIALVAYFAAVGLAAVPIALSCVHWSLRLAMLIATSAVLGCVPVLLHIREEAALALLVAGSLAACAWAVPSNLIRIAAAGIAAPLVVVAVMHVRWDAVQGEWIARGMVAVGMSSTCMLLLRAAGYRLVALSPEGWDEHFEAGTGRDLDAWCDWLDAQPTALDFRSQIVAALRREGLDPTWAETVASAYARYRGISALAGASPGMRAYAVPSPAGRPLWQEIDLRAVRFSVTHLMVWVTVIAAVLGFMRWVVGGFPTANDVVYGPPLIAMLCLSTFASAVAALSMPRRGAASLRLFVLVMAVLLAVPGWFVSQQIPAAALGLAGAVAIVAAATTFAGFLLLRHRGYRLLRVRLVAEPST